MRGVAFFEADPFRGGRMSNGGSLGQDSSNRTRGGSTRRWALGLAALTTAGVLTTTDPAWAQSAPVSDQLVVHLRADTGVSTDTTGGVTDWLDLAPDGDDNSALQLRNGERPFVVPDAINGQPALRFDGVNDVLSIGPSEAMTTDTVTWYVVFAPASIPAATRPGVDDAAGILTTGFATGAGPASNRTWGSHLSRASEVVSYARSMDGTSVGGVTPIVANETYVLSATWRTDDSVVQSVNGVPEVPALPASALPATHVGTDIGAFPLTGSLFTRFFDGDIAEILVYAADLSDRERTEIEAYLADRYQVAGAFDFDGDGDQLPIGEEIALGTDPFNPDTDGDGLLDGEEFALGCPDPLIADTDGDGMSDGVEVAQGTDPCSGDSDGDGLSDADELALGCSDPTNEDSDGDTLLDGEEVLRGLDPCLADTDGDGLDDGDEVAFGCLDPLNVDTDGDGVFDGVEVANGTDPCRVDEELAPDDDVQTPVMVAEFVGELSDFVAALEPHHFGSCGFWSQKLLRKSQTSARYAARIQAALEKKQLRRQRWIVRRLDRIAHKAERGNFDKADREIEKLLRRIDRDDCDWMSDTDARADLVDGLDEALELLDELRGAF